MTCDSMFLAQTAKANPDWRGEGHDYLIDLQQDLLLIRNMAVGDGPIPLA